MVTRDLICVGALLLSGCGAAPIHPSKPQRLPADVYIIASEDMAVLCRIGWCEDFRTPPVEIIWDFEKRLPSLLKAIGRDDLVAKLLTSYVRQYWAVASKHGLDVVGNFVCRSQATYMPSIFSEEEPMTPEMLARSPIVIDDAGICLVTVTFPAGRPQEAEFSVARLDQRLQ